MARLTDPLAKERPVPALAGGIARIDPGQAPDLGRGLQVLGKDLSTAGAEVFQAQEVEQDRVDTLVAEDAFTKLRERQLDLTAGEQNGFNRLRGASAVTRPVYDEWGKRFDDAQSEIASGLANDQQRGKFKLRADVARVQYREEILRHLAREGDTYAKEVYDGMVAVEQRNAVARWDSPNDVALSLQRIKAAVDDRANYYNWTPEYRESVTRLEQGKVHAAVVQQALASGNYEFAQEWYQAHREDVDLATAKQLARDVEDGVQKQITAGYNARYLSNEDSQPALAMLRRDVLSDEVLDETRRNILVGRIQNREAVLERRAEIAEDRRLRQIERGIGELNSSTLAGYEPTAEQFAPLVDAARGTELETEVQAAIRLAESTRAFRNLPPLQQERTLTAAEAGIRLEPTKFDRRVVSAWRQIFDAQRRAVMDDPTTFAVQQGLVAPQAPLDLSQPEAAGPALRQRYELARGMSYGYQAPMKPLTTEETRLLVATLQNASLEEKRNYMASLAKASGGDTLGTQGYLAVMSQLAPDDPVTAIAGANAARGLTKEADLLLRGQAILRPPAKTDGKTDGTGLLPMPPETEMRERYDSQVRDLFAGKENARSDHYQAVKAAYAALSIDAGDRDTKVLNKDRWDQAIKIAVGTILSYNHRRIVLPHQYDEGRFRDEVRDRIGELVDRSAQADAAISRIENTLTPQEKRIVQYHRDNVRTGQVGRDQQGRPVSVYSTGILIPEGPNKGKFVAVPGFVGGRIVDDEAALYQHWKAEIDAGQWPLYPTGEALNQRSQQIHQIMEIESSQPRLDSSWTHARLRNLPLVGIRSGQYSFQTSVGVVTDKLGAPVILDFNQPFTAKPKPAYLPIFGPPLTVPEPAPGRAPTPVPGRLPAPAAAPAPTLGPGGGAPAPKPQPASQPSSQGPIRPPSPAPQAPVPAPGTVAGPVPAPRAAAPAAPPAPRAAAARPPAPPTKAVKEPKYRSPSEFVNEPTTDYLRSIEPYLSKEGPKRLGRGDVGWLEKWLPWIWASDRGRAIRYVQALNDTIQGGGYGDRFPKTRRYDLDATGKLVIAR